MKFSLRGIFKRGKEREKREEHGRISLEDAESFLKVSTVEKELIRLVLDVLEKARERSLIDGVEAERLNSKYRAELERVEKEIDRYAKVLKLLDLRRVRDSLYKGYWRRIRAVEEAMKELAASIGEEAIPLLKPPKEPTEVRGKPPISEGLKPLREEILKVMEKLEEMEVEDQP